MENVASEINRKLEVLRTRQKNYDSLKQSLIKTAKTVYGASIIDDYSIPAFFDVRSLNKEEALVRIDQTVPMPYSNEDFNEFLTMPKHVINNIFCEAHGRKFVQSMFLIGKNKKGQYALFSFSIVRDKKEKDNYSIKLDIKPQGKFWMPVARLDCATGMAHPNFLENGTIAENYEGVTRVPTPHLHLYSEACQVLFYDELEYALAKNMNHLVDLTKPLEDKENLMKCLNYMLELCNVNVRTTNVDTSLYGNYLFDFEDVQCVATPKELEK